MEMANFKIYFLKISEVFTNSNWKTRWQPHFTKTPQFIEMLKRCDNFKNIQ